MDWKQLSNDVVVKVFQDVIQDEKDAVSKLQEFEVIIAMRERTAFQEILLKQLPQLKLLVTTGMRNLSIDMNAAARLGIVVSGTGMLGYPTAELTWTLILALARNLNLEEQSMKKGNWHVSLGIGLKGKTLGLYGLGKLGSQVAKVGQAFGMHTIAWSSNLTQELCNKLEVDLVTQEDLFCRSDFLSIHLVLSDRTRGCIGQK